MAYTTIAQVLADSHKLTKQQMVDAIAALPAPKTNAGYKWTDEQRAKLRATMATKETRQKISNGVRASMTPEVRKRISDGVRASMTPEVKAKIAASNNATWAAKRREQESLRQQVAELQAIVRLQQQNKVVTNYEPHDDEVADGQRDTLDGWTAGGAGHNFTHS